MVNFLDPRTQPKFINPLPDPQKIDATKGGKFTVDIKKSEQWLGLYNNPGPDGTYGTNDDVRLNTTVWGYGRRGQANVTYPGPTFEAKSNVPIEVVWDNRLPLGAHLFQTEIRSTPEEIQSNVRRPLAEGEIPTVTHLHGGHTESASDGIPEAWFTQNFANTGPDWVKKNYTYDNSQEAATLWYHDHARDITRLNVYAGLAGFYLLRDNNENNLIKNGVLPGDSYEREIVLQDKRFDTEGQLVYSSEPLPGIPDRTGTYGDFILANGMAWPKLEVEPRKYRLRLLNGSDSRFYNLSFNDTNEKIYQIGTEQGLLEKPVAHNRLLMAPGERVDVIVDFTGDAGKEFTLRNFGPGAEPGTTGEIMKVEVDRPLSNVPNASVDTNEADGLTTKLRPNSITPPAQTGATRQVVLYEIDRPGNETISLLGTLKDGSLRYREPVTETPTLGTTEVWEIFNATVHPHAIHLHLVNFQILNRQRFSSSTSTVTAPESGELKQYIRDVSLTGNPQRPLPYERGLKDTVVVNPGEVVRITATFDRPGEYVWHCHILSHEDNDMMRPIEVVPTPTSATEDELLASGLATTGKLTKEDELLAGGLTATEEPLNTSSFEFEPLTMGQQSDSAIKSDSLPFAETPLFATNDGMTERSHLESSLVV